MLVQIDWRDVFKNILVEVISFKLKLSDMKELVFKIGVHVVVGVIFGFVPASDWSLSVGAASQTRREWQKAFFKNLL